jgi:Domain of unknown function (DUF222)
MVDLSHPFFSIKHMFEELSAVDPDADEAALVARISALEKAKSAAAAGQARATAALDTARRTAEAARGVASAQRGHGLGAEVGLARHDSPQRGREHLGFAKVLVHDMPHTLAALAAGALSEYRATLIVAAAMGLSPADRAVLDAALCADHDGLIGMGNKKITNQARSIAYRLDSRAAAERATRAPHDRTVTVRPARDGMAYLTAFLPMPQAMSVHSALNTAADASTDGRGRGQVMADTLIQRVTGRPADAPVPVAVNLVLTDEALLGGDSTPARIPGYGPIPASIARRMIGTAVWDDRSRATLRRLYRHPTSGALVAMQSRARLFPKGLSAFIDLRDDTCRTPYCDAPIRHHDHAQPAAHGGATSGVNGLGMCEACNYTKEAPGWQVTTTTDHHGTHTAQFTTPTGTHHRSNAPPLPGRPRPRPSTIETAFADILSRRDAA